MMRIGGIGMAAFGAVLLVTAGCGGEERDIRISLDDAAVEENAPAGTLVGTFSALPAGEWVFELVDGEGGEDNARFTIDGNHLETAEPLDFEGGEELHIRVRGARDDEDASKRFTISLEDVNEPPAIIDVGGLALTQNTVVTSGATIAFTVVDPDAGDSFTPTVGGGSIAPGGPFTGNCAGASCTVDVPVLVRATAGQFALTVTVTDSASASSTADASVVIAPTLVTNDLDDGGDGTLRKAIADAAPGDVIAFDPTFFNETMPRTISIASELVLDRAITIEGPGSEVLALSGGTVSRIANILGPVEVSISGLTIRDGTAPEGGGVRSEGFLTLEHVVVRDNVSGDMGGGVFCENRSLDLRHVTFDGNSSTGLFGGGGGLAAFFSCTVRIEDSFFVRNTTDFRGGGIMLFNSPATISGSRFESNSAAELGGGLFAHGASPTDIRDSEFIANAVSPGSAGGAIASTASMKITNTVFELNMGGSGGAVFAAGATEILNASFARNTSTSDAGNALRAESADGTVSIVNSILWNSGSGPELTAAFGASTTIAFSIVGGSGGSGAAWDTALGTDGGGNLDADPLFLDAANGDLRVHESSPAVDRGRNADVEGLVTDLDAAPRVVDGNANGIATVDLGAYELQLAP